MKEERAKTGEEQENRAIFEGDPNMATETMTRNGTKRRCADLVDAYFMIQETRKRMDLREQAMCRDEVILKVPSKTEGDKKLCGKIVGSENGTITVLSAGQGKEVTVKREDVRKVIEARFDDVEKARSAIYQWPVGKRMADISSLVFLRMEEDIKREIQGMLREWPVWVKWLKNVKGIGPISAGGIWAHVDIRIADSPSKLWHFAGHHLDGEGKVPHLAKGVKRTWNRRLQTIVWNAGESIVRTKGGYRDLYDQFKAEEIESRFYSAASPEDLAGGILAEQIGKYKPNARIKDLAHAKRVFEMAEKAERKSDAMIIAEAHDDMPLSHWALRAAIDSVEERRLTIKAERTPGHIDRRARRRMRKVLLGHVWTVWRQEEGLPIRPVYIIGRDGHSREIPIPSE